MFLINHSLAVCSLTLTRINGRRQIRQDVLLILEVAAMRGTEPRQKEKEGDDQYLGARIVGSDIGLDVDLNEREKSQMAPEFLPQH